VVARTSEVEWWADEQWRLESSWSPVGFTVFLTFLVDPQHDGPRAPGQAVWAVSISPDEPRSRAAAEQVRHAALQEGKLPDVVRAANELRSRAV
jgi:hypothetical protein